MLSGVALAVGRASYRLDSASSAPAATATPGVPIRVTRPARYSLYRASDGAWYLGQRDWNPATLRFNTIQPVSGPFLSAASDGLHFRYFDSTGAELPSGTSSTRSIALIRIALNAQTQRVVHASGFAVTSAGRHADSVLVTVRARNRR